MKGLWASHKLSSFLTCTDTLSANERELLSVLNYWNKLMEHIVISHCVPVIRAFGNVCPITENVGYRLDV